MGSLFGGLLAAAGEEVWLFDVWEAHVKAIQNSGLTIVSPQGELVTKPQATTDLEAIGRVDLVVIFVKSTATSDAANVAVRLLNPDTAVLTLQNGYGNAEQLAAVVGKERVVAGTTAQGATLLGPGRIMHAGRGETHIGEYEGRTKERTHMIARILSRAGIQTFVDENVASLIWGKLLINVGINAITALTGLKNGEILDHAETLELMKMAVAEAEAVAGAAGISLPYPAPLQKVMDVARATAENRSSMLQDVTNRRLTEIEAINGAIVREGRRLGIATPVNQALVLLVKMKEKSY
jgi:2-dehydropantoate 2-reductase